MSDNSTHTSTHVLWNTYSHIQCVCWPVGKSCECILLLGVTISRGNKRRENRKRRQQRTSVCVVTVHVHVYTHCMCVVSSLMKSKKDDGEEDGEGKSEPVSMVKTSGCILHFSCLAGDKSREDLREDLLPFGTVAFVDFDRGKTEVSLEL